MRDVAEVKDTTEDVRSLLRINGTAGVRMQVQKQSGTNTVAISDAVRTEIDRINREMPNIKLSGPGRQRDLHQAIDRVGAGARHHRIDPGDADHLRVPAQFPLDVDRVHVDSDLGDRHVRAASTSPGSR
jgi:hypothetical protein